MIVGIDLGTTNSLVGIWRDGEPALIPNSFGEYLTPSVVGIAADGTVVVGQPARERLVSHPDVTTAIFKRYMGTDKEIKVGSHTFRAEELSALVLRSLKADAEAFLGASVTSAVITVPAYFNDAQRKATKIAGQLAGLAVERLLTEPTAAALAYGFSGSDADTTILVVDFGGGTLDISLLHSFEGIMEVKATAGDMWLGGEDFTDAIASTFSKDLSDEIKAARLTEDATFRASVRRQAELAKRALTNGESATITANFSGKCVEWKMTRDRFEETTAPLLARVRLPLDRALRDGRTAPDRISKIIFAGGAARMPMFRSLISRLFRQLPLSHINPEEVVARGACVRVGLLQHGQGLEEHVLTDVAPFTLGVEVAERFGLDAIVNGMFLPIIERNTIIPASRSHVLHTIMDDQSRVLLKVYQGESRFTRDNVYLGEVSVRVPREAAGKEKVEVRFTYDTSGLLEVDATVSSTGLREHLLIEGNPGILSKEEIRNRLNSMAKLKLHPREDSANLSVIARADRLFAELLGEARTHIAAALTTFLGAIETQDPHHIETARANLVQLLDAIERPMNA